jgi:cellulose synthase/poly-beta-1,6-N-acetylglucosamine synthase-like glycosyltransferase
MVEIITKVYTYIYIHIYIYEYMYIHIYLYIHIYIYETQPSSPETIKNTKSGPNRPEQSLVSTTINVNELFRNDNNSQTIEKNVETFSFLQYLPLEIHIVVEEVRSVILGGYLCVFMSIFMGIYAYICIYIHIHICIYVCISIRTFIYQTNININIRVMARSSYHQENSG